MGAAALPAAMTVGGMIVNGLGGAFTPNPPPPIRRLPQNEAAATNFQPTNFVSIMDELMGNRMDLVRGVDGRISLNITDPNQRPTSYPIDGRISDQALGIIAISDAMTRLGNTIQEIENTNPFLISQNQDLINNYKTAVKSALDNGFDFKQQSIDSKLAKMGLSKSSAALNMQLGLAREKANSYANLALKESELAQNLKQQSIQNLNTRSKILNDQAGVGLNQMSQNLQMRKQDIQKELNYATLNQNRNQMGINAGINLLNSGNQNALNARQIDNNLLANINNANLQNYNMQGNPLGNALNLAGGLMIGGGIDNILNPQRPERPERPAR